ncbi:COG3014 family protein [Mucilaginibacter antarcticus]|uniref:COG3014 family protein n=1 Tax=Mucilaginibacter antarcticus TaxID=1855725 RepID=A0ABW5XSR8_9SPHI
MTYLRTHILKASSIIMLVLFLLGCATYNERITLYYQNVHAGNYKQAEKTLDGNSLIKKPRNRLLYLIEKGRVSHLNGQYDVSNRYFNEADQLLDQGLGGAADGAVGVFVNSMSQTYKGEDFEKFMIHYYKALNYVYLNKTEDAIVEARRITLQAQQQTDKFNNKDNRYSNDAFSLTLQGMLYESVSDINNAFIAYRNAAEVYLKAPDQTWYGITIPLTLQQDVIRTARLNGFNTEAEEFERKFGITYSQPSPSEGGELVVFWENGLAPVKTQADMLFTLVRQSNGDLFFTDVGGGIIIPFNYGGDRGRVNTKAVESLHIAYPKYIAQNPYFTGGSVSVNGQQLSLVKTEDINELAFKTLQQRALQEMGKILSRQAVKKMAEYSVRQAATSNGKTNGWLEGLGYGLQLYNALSEKADTRNWQTLPAYIAYARIPLNMGENKVDITLRNAQGVEEIKTITVQGNGRLQFYNYATLK